MRKMNDQVLFCPNCKEETAFKFNKETDPTYIDGKYYFTTECYCPKCKKYFFKKDVYTITEHNSVNKKGQKEKKKEEKKKKTPFEKEFDDFVWYTPFSW
jgi:uncharacterized protein YbaR (Trm112 family)